MKTTTIIIGFILLILLIPFGLKLVGLANYSFFAPKYEEVRREVYENTKSYNDGVIRELQNMMLEYRTSNAEGKAALKSIVLHRAVDFPNERLPNDVQNFIRELKGY